MIVVASTYSAGLRKRPWLSEPSLNPTIQHKALFIPPPSAYPVQQMLVRRQFSLYGDKFSYDCVHLADGLLKPERLAAGFVFYLNTLAGPYGEPTSNIESQMFCFSSAPASLAADPLISAEISPILAESFSGSSRSLLVRDLQPEIWTVLVSFELHQARPANAKSIRYAFVRPHRLGISADLRNQALIRGEDLEVVGLKDFLAIMAPGVDQSVVDRRMHELTLILTTNRGQDPLPHGVEPVSVMSRVEAWDLLLDCLRHGEKAKQRLRQS